MKKRTGNEVKKLIQDAEETAAITAAKVEGALIDPDNNENNCFEKFKQPVPHNVRFVNGGIGGSKNSWSL